MKVVFVENKHKTRFWERIAQELSNGGHEISWIVQNKLFSPKVGYVHVIPLPKNKDLHYSEKFKTLEKKDRYCYIYDQKPTHYSYYYKSINRVLTEIEPDFVFGESTLFHELLTIQCCREKSILYLNPSTCRYPTERFSFYKYDTQEPYLGSNDVWSNELVDQVIEQVTLREKQPDYMQKPSSLKKVSYHIRRSKGLVCSFMSSEFLGETYNTPSLRQKRKVESFRRLYYQNYESLAIESIDKFETRNTLVFPLQMQPESNIDVWGYPYNSQSDLVRQLSKNLGEGWNILIKPNPKSKYEISKELLDSIKTSTNVYALKHNVDMKALFKKFDFFFSVTGTINHETILSGKKKCFSPSLPITKKFSPTTAKLPIKQDLLADEIINKNNSRLLISYLISSSFSGLIGDDIHTPQVFSAENISSVSKAFFSVLSRK